MIQEPSTKSLIVFLACIHYPGLSESTASIIERIIFSELDPWLHWTWVQVLWPQDGGRIQETNYEWTSHHLPPIMPPFTHLLFHDILQAILFWGPSHRQPFCYAGHHKPLYKVYNFRNIDFIIKLFFVLKVWWKNFLLPLMFAWLIFG